MLRNSTQQFKEKYEKNGLIAYWSSDLLASRKKELLPNQKQAMNATWTKNAKISSCSAKKLQTTSLSRVNKARQMHARDKESLSPASTSHLAYRRHQIVVKPHEADQESETSISSVNWKLKDPPSTHKREPQEFINSLPKNEVFYCCECFQYVFGIEKSRHFPDCRDRVEVTRQNRENFAALGWERLRKLVELATYSGIKVWEIEQLYSEVVNHDFSKIYSISYPAESRFFTLDQILWAFVYTYERFLRGSVFEKKSIFSCF